MAIYLNLSINYFSNINYNYVIIFIIMIISLRKNEKFESLKILVVPKEIKKI